MKNAIFILIGLLIISGIVNAVNITVERTLPSSIGNSQVITVSLVMNTSGAINPAVAIKEYIPAGWGISAVSFNGTYNPSTNGLEWLFWSEGTPIANRTITYNLTSPSYLSTYAVTASVAGTYYDSEDTYVITGDTTLLINGTSAVNSMKQASDRNTGIFFTVLSIYPILAIAGILLYTLIRGGQAEAQEFGVLFTLIFIMYLALSIINGVYSAIH